jgi:hypothetical protein
VALPTLIRWSGLAALLGGVLLIVSQLLRLTLGLDDPIIQAVDSVLGLLFTVLLLLGLVGLYASQSETAGVLGLVGFLVAFFGTVGTAITFTGALAGFGGTLTLVLFILGWILLGVATLHGSRIYPRAAAVLLIVGAAILLFPLILPIDVPFISAVFAVAVAWLGYSLFARKGGEASQSTHVR